MTPFLLGLLLFIGAAVYLSRNVKRVIIKPIARSGLVGPELLAEKTRLDVLKEKVRPMAWGVVVGAVLWPVIGWIVD